MVNFYRKNRSHLRHFDEDIIMFFSYLQTFDFFQEANTTIEQWIKSKKYNIGGRHATENDLFTLQDMAKEIYGNNLVRDKLMSLEWHKR